MFHVSNSEDVFLVRLETSFFPARHKEIHGDTRSQVGTSSFPARIQGSFSPTFYARLLRTKVAFKAFLCFEIKLNFFGARKLAQMR